jgi:hypothetical protein
MSKLVDARPSLLNPNSGAGLRACGLGQGIPQAGTPAPLFSKEGADATTREGEATSYDGRQEIMPIQENKRMNKTTKAILCVLTLVLSFLSFSTSPAQAQDKWGVTMLMYGMGAGMEGKVGALGQTADVDLSFSDILKNLEFGFMGGARAYKGNWSVTGDVIYTGLGMENDLVKADVNQWIVGSDVGYQVSHSVEVLGGFRINALRNTLDFKGPHGITVKPKKSWVDPVVGIRFAPALSDKWSLWSRFDIGGFGVGSDFTWEVNALVVRKFSDRTSLTFGYRVLGVNYDKGEGVKRFLYDVTISGPVVGMAMSF